MNKPIEISFDPSIPLTQNDQRLFNGGYLFLQDIYFQLGFDKICKAIARKHGFKYNLNSILSRLLFTRILYPSSKLSSFALSSRFIEKPIFLSKIFTVPYPSLMKSRITFSPHFIGTA